MPHGVSGEHSERQQRSHRERVHRAETEFKRKKREVSKAILFFPRAWYIRIFPSSTEYGVQK